MDDGRLTADGGRRRTVFQRWAVGRTDLVKESVMTAKKKVIKTSGRGPLLTALQHIVSVSERSKAQERLEAPG